MDTNIPTTITAADLPRIGEPLAGGLYAGLSTDGEKAYPLVLLPGDEEFSWKAANDWTEKQGGVLPSRIDQLVLRKNLPGEFKPDWYWSGEPSVGNESYAWCQDFYGGYQDGYHEVTKLRARAVRRLTLV